MDWNKFYDKAYTWILTVGPKILIGLIIVFVGLWLIRVIKRWMNHHLMKRDVASSVRPFLINLIVTILQVLLVFAFMQIAGIEMTIFATIVGAFGVAAGLALSGTLQNFTSGILILFLKPFRVGDNVIAQGIEGTVDTIQIFFTVVKTFDNKTVIIPNSKLSNEVITNLSREGKRRMDIELKFNYGIDINEIKQILEKSIIRRADLLKEPAHRIGISSIEADGYKMMVNVWAPAHGYQDAKLLLQEELVQDLKTAGIKLPGMT
jgi:small conductance mechanosensitive channel